MRAVSDKRKSENLERLRLMIEKFGLPSTWHCQFERYRCLHPIVKVQKQDRECWGVVSGHEILKRSRGGSIIDMSNVVLLCTYHNGWVEDHPYAANQLGLALHNWDQINDENQIRYGSKGPIV